jgi:hypothetical protein
VALEPQAPLAALLGRSHAPSIPEAGPRAGAGIFPGN